MDDRFSSSLRARAPGPSGGPATPDMLPALEHRLDLTVVLGLGSAVLMVLAALALDGSPGAFLNLPSLLIVLGGTAAVTIISFSWADVGAAWRTLCRTVRAPATDLQATALAALAIADHARRNGPLSLQPLAGPARDEPVLARALDLIVDALPAENAERILRTEIEANQARARTTTALLRRAAEVAPAMGLIGTLVGLVQMLGSLDEPSKIGPAMAVALLTTFYGAILGSMVLSPLAAKVERNAEHQALVEGIYLLTAGSVARQENPRHLEVLINTVLPPDHRISAYD